MIPKIAGEKKRVNQGKTERSRPKIAGTLPYFQSPGKPSCATLRPRDCSGTAGKAAGGDPQSRYPLGGGLQAQVRFQPQNRQEVYPPQSSPGTLPQEYGPKPQPWQEKPAMKFHFLKMNQLGLEGLLLMQLEPSYRVLELYTCLFPLPHKGPEVFTISLQSLKKRFFESLG